MVTSVYCTLEARTRTRTSPGPAVGIGASTSSSSSGPPKRFRLTTRFSMSPMCIDQPSCGARDAKGCVTALLRQLQERTIVVVARVEIAVAAGAFGEVVKEVRVHRQPVARRALDDVDGVVRILLGAPDHPAI